MLKSNVWLALDRFNHFITCIFSHRIEEVHTTRIVIVQESILNFRRKCQFWGPLTSNPKMCC